MDNRLRETAVKVAVWASTQHIIAEVWFAGRRVTSGSGDAATLDIVVVMLDHAQQVQVRRSGRQTSTASWEKDVSASVRERHTLHILTGQVPEQMPDAVRIFSRGDAPAGEIRCTPQRAETTATDAGKGPTEVRGDHANVRTV